MTRPNNLDRQERERREKLAKDEAQQRRISSQEQLDNIKAQQKLAISKAATPAAHRHAKYPRPSASSADEQAAASELSSEQESAPLEAGPRESFLSQASNPAKKRAVVDILLDTLPLPSRATRTDRRTVGFPADSGGEEDGYAVDEGGPAAVDGSSRWTTPVDASPASHQPAPRRDTRHVPGPEARHVPSWTGSDTSEAYDGASVAGVPGSGWAEHCVGGGRWCEHREQPSAQEGGAALSREAQADRLLRTSNEMAMALLENAHRPRGKHSHCWGTASESAAPGMQAEHSSAELDDFEATLVMRLLDLRFFG